MKVESIRIQNFKLFDNLEVNFKNKILDEVSDRFLILGDNGSNYKSIDIRVKSFSPTQIIVLCSLALELALFRSPTSILEIVTMYGY
ncbi:MAG: hypothetical protein QNJ63_19475 [Calothrix sp. MO_192.B10]|nr:hypothetical protein [Calothrix sp. MO_192.B10]